MRIIFEFAGGPLDGKSVIGRHGEQDEADRYYALTHHGKIGQRFRIASDYAVEILAREQLKIDAPHHFQQHVYRVTDRLEGEDEVLIRAEYVDKSGDERLMNVGDPLAEEADPEARGKQRIREILADTQRSWTTAYSHCWPREAAADDAPLRHLTVHLAHAMLSRNFSVFLDAPQPGYPGSPVHLLGIAPGQDWFLACRGIAVAGPEDAERVRRAAAQLSSFWLGPHLAPLDSRGYIDQVARHCQRGYGLVSATHWHGRADKDNSLPRSWGAAIPFSSADPHLPSDAEWPAPLVLGQLARRGTCHWLTTFFRIPRTGVGMGG
jgi:hypothetical protein